MTVLDRELRKAIEDKSTVRIKLALPGVLPRSISVGIRYVDPYFIKVDDGGDVYWLNKTHCSEIEIRGGG